MRIRVISIWRQQIQARTRFELLHVTNDLHLASRVGAWVPQENITFKDRAKGHRSRPTPPGNINRPDSAVPRPRSTAFSAPHQQPRSHRWPHARAPAWAEGLQVRAACCRSDDALVHGRGRPANPAVRTARHTGEPRVVSGRMTDSLLLHRAGAVASRGVLCHLVWQQAEVPHGCHVGSLSVRGCDSATTCDVPVVALSFPCRGFPSEVKLCTALL